MNNQKRRKYMELACTWSLLSGGNDYWEIFRRHLKEKYLKIGVDKCYHHGKHIESQLLLVKDHGISEETPCGIPQQDHFIDMEHVFDPSEEGSSSSRTVVLQGSVVHKFMFDWAAGTVTPGREICHIANLSAADLITNTFQDINGPILDTILIYPEKILFILDGFPELQDPVGDQEEDLSVHPQERKPVEGLLCSFVRKKLLPDSSLLITARPTTMKLHSLLKQPIQAEILRFTDTEKTAYLLSQFSGANTSMKNEDLDFMSSLPIVSWMICSVLQSQGDGDRTLLRSLQTMTDVYLFYFSKCLKTLTGISVWEGQSCLWGLCCLAAEGLQNHQVLFAVGDLRRHGIGVCDTNYIFLSRFLKKAEGAVSVYTFLHFSFQEFLTAVFHALKNDNTEKMWQEIEIKDKASRLQIEPVDLFHCLYEIQEEENHLLGFEEEERASTFVPLALTLNQSFQLCSLPVSQLHLLCQALRNPYCKIKDLRDLSLVFETNQHLTDLEFVKNTLEDSGMKLLCEGLKQPNCQDNLLFDTLILGVNFYFSAVLSTNQWLTELEFSETKLEASALKLLCEGLKDTNCKLQKLKLCASLLPEGSEAVCRYLSCVLICNPDLTELDPSENPLGDIGVKYLCVGLRHSNCKVEKLDLSTCHSTDASCVELSSFLQVSQALKELFVFANVLGDTGVQHLCEGLQHTKGIIENLLSEYSLSAACCEPLAQVLSSTRSLTRLILINNKIEDMGLKLLCEGLKQPDCHLKDLALWTCHLSGACCQDLCNVLYTNEHLRDLDFSDNALGDEGMRVLCEGLKCPCCKLQTLWLAECHLTDTCCGALASVLNRDENLTLLDLSGNDLKDFGVQMLCDALIHPICKLQTFYLDTDPLREDAFRKMEVLKMSKPGITCCLRECLI
uniref:NACHT domain-containing protein n=1 Tax=Mandrillus leucophaeus TaxID=9568 RepID=A0A2K5YMS2_MANLE